MSHKLVSLYIGDGEYYTRTDADNVISELKAQKAQVEDDCAYWKMSEGNAVNAMHETEEACMFLTKSERHQKYRRCLAMASYWGLVGACTHGLIQLKCMRREMKWRKLAEKFKEAE